MKQSLLRWPALILLAFALRVYSLQSPPLAWDEGWSVAISQLPLRDIAYLTAADVHPPGYYLLLRGWLALGHAEFVVRYLSLLAGVLAVPLAYQAGRAWVGRGQGAYSEGSAPTEVGAAGPGGRESTDVDAPVSRPRRGTTSRRLPRPDFQSAALPLGQRGRFAEGVGWLTAAYVAVAPLLVYYSQVARMYALCVAGVLLAVAGLLRSLDPDRPAPWPALLGWTVGALVALYSFYYSALALAALSLYALWRSRPLWGMPAGRRGLGRFALASGAIALAYVPWLLYAVGPVTERVSERTEGAVRLAHLGDLLGAGLYAVVFAYGPGWLGVWVVALVVLAGAVLGNREQGLGDGDQIPSDWKLGLEGVPPTVGLRRREPRPRRRTPSRRLSSLDFNRWFPHPQSLILLSLPVLAIALTLVGVALGTQAHMFAARYTIAASPFIALALAYAVAALGVTSRRLGLAAGLLALGTALWPLWGGQVYAKGLERSGDFEPWTDAQALRAAGARADDVVVFNLLSLAGAYDVYRQPGDPPWTYAQRWDPVTEAWPRAEARLQAATADPRRVWALLYKGAVAGNAQLKDWLDGHLYPVRAEWRGDTLLSLYLTEGQGRADAAPGATWPEGITLVEVGYPATIGVADGVTIDLKWQAARELGRDYTVFVHLYDAGGRLVAQHDGPPRGGSRSTSRWTPGKPITDYHGLLLPPATSGVLSLRVGWYDPATGQRLRLTDGRDMVEVGTVRVEQ